MAGSNILKSQMEITLENLQKKTLIPQGRIFKAVKAAFRKLKNPGHIDFFKKDQSVPVFSSLSIVFVGTKRMRAINRKFLGHDFVTDVLTFDMGEGLGEIIICPQMARTQAKTHQTSTDQEIILYVIHGILHLAGFDDHKPQDILQMRRMENKLLE